MGAGSFGSIMARHLCDNVELAREFVAAVRAAPRVKWSATPIPGMPPAVTTLGRRSPFAKSILIAHEARIVHRANESRVGMLLA
jgi:hypothetical protein